MSSSGRVVAVLDAGTIWQLLYERDGDGLGVVNSDWRMFASMYEAESGRSFFQDYRFGAGRAAIQNYFMGRTIHVETDEEERVWFE